MKRFDRIVFVALLIGVWALVLKPSDTDAHPNMLVDCSVSGTAFGNLLEETVTIYDFNGVSVDCILL